MFTFVTNGDRSQLDDLNDVMRIARPDDPVYVATRGSMLVAEIDTTQRRGSTGRTLTRLP